MHSNTKTNGPGASVSGPKTSEKNTNSDDSYLLSDGRVRWKVEANNKLRKLSKIDRDGNIRLLYNEYPEPPPMNIKVVDDDYCKGLSKEDATEAYSALGADSKSFIESLYEAGMISGLRNITHVATGDKEWPIKKE